MLRLQPKRIRRNGRPYSRVSVIIKLRSKAEQLRAIVHDALIRAGGFRAARHLTDALARSGDKHRTYIRDPKTTVLKHRLKEYARRGEIGVWIAGKAI